MPGYNQPIPAYKGYVDPLTVPRTGYSQQGQVPNTAFQYPDTGSENLFQYDPSIQERGEARLSQSIAPQMNPVPEMMPQGLNYPQGTIPDASLSQYPESMQQPFTANNDLQMLQANELQRQLNTNSPSNDAIASYMQSLDPRLTVDPRALVQGLGLQEAYVDPMDVVRGLDQGATTPRKPRTTKVADKSAVGSEGNYTVTKGDTLSDIAKKLGTTVKELQSGRGTKSKNALSIGEKLSFNSIPSAPTKLPSSVTVAKGDTLTKIAKRLGVSVGDLQKGRIKSADRLAIGETLDLSGLA